MGRLLSETANGAYVNGKRKLEYELRKIVVTIL